MQFDHYGPTDDLQGVDVPRPSPGDTREDEVFILIKGAAPTGIKGMLREAGRDKSMPRPDGYQVSPERMAQAAKDLGNDLLGLSITPVSGLAALPVEPRTRSE